MYTYFSDKELRCKCGKCNRGQETMNTGFMAKLEAIRVECGFPLHVTSAYRCPAHNMAVSTSGFDGPHTTGRAVDIAISHEHAVVFLRTALKHGMTGIGVSQKGRSRFIHVDDLGEGYPRPNIWSY